MLACLGQKLCLAALHLPVLWRHMLRDGGKSVADIGTSVTGDTLARRKDLDHGRRQAYFDEIAFEGVRHAVAMGVHDHMVVEIDTRLAPLALAEGMLGQRQKSREVDTQKQRGAGAAEALGGLIVVQREQSREGLVKFGQRVEGVVSKMTSATRLALSTGSRHQPLHTRDNHWKTLQNCLADQEMADI